MNNSQNNIDLNNDEFQTLWNLIQNTHQSVFLTGKAGTGKSTFLRYICENTSKKHVVLAPTGIAAVNVGGQTLHSFFKIPFKPLLPGDPDFMPRRINKTLRYTKDKVKLIRELDLIIIDEISMVRADIIDFVDKVLKHYSGNRREPFGGKQLLFVGDIFQLEPVVTRDMREILQRYYKQFFFFNAHVFDQLGLVPIELKKIYRQTDDQFISLLDRVRINKAMKSDISLLNSRCNQDYESQEMVITLATRRDTVNAINDEKMAAIKNPEFLYKGVIEGTFPDNDLPTALELRLKKDAQVIFIRNDKDGRWVNGTIGMISNLTDDSVWVVTEDGCEYELEVEMWENIQYTFDEKKDAVVENVLGSFAQFPVKPAWALTVHKSQGLTFNHVVIDFAGGAFTGGQTYVALSRCTSLEGIVLLKPLSERDIIVNPAVVDFSRRFNDSTIINDAFNQEKAGKLYRKAIHAFDHDEFRTCIECFAQAMTLKNVLGDPVIQRFIAIKFNRFANDKIKIKHLEQKIETQQNMLSQLAMEFCQMGDLVNGFGSEVGEGSTPYGNQLTADEIAIKSAFSNYDKALRIDPMCTSALIGKGRLFIAIDEHDKAKEEFSRALKIDADNFECHMSLGYLFHQEKNISETIKSYKRAIKADKKRPEPHERLEEIYERLGLDDLAELHHEKALKLRTSKKRKPKQN